MGGLHGTNIVLASPDVAKKINGPSKDAEGAFCVGSGA